LKKEAAELALDELERIWGDKYPIVIQSWRKKWDSFSVTFRFSEATRKVIYTTNSIEAVRMTVKSAKETRKILDPLGMPIRYNGRVIEISRYCVRIKPVIKPSRWSD